jgi:hypothetical protein
LDRHLRRRATIAVTAIERSILITAIWRRLDGDLWRWAAVAPIEASSLIATIRRCLDRSLRRRTAAMIAAIDLAALWRSGLA